MKLLEKLKKWIASVTAISLVFAFLPTAALAHSDGQWKLDRPHATIDGGSYSSEKEVKLELDESAKCTAYTLDNSYPDRESAKYVTGAKIRIGAGTTTLKARSYNDNACASNDHASDLMIETYRITLPDTTAPVLTMITPVATPTNDITPSFVFNSTEAGTAAYSGNCGNGNLLIVIAGNNNVTYPELDNGTYSNCAITVTDSHQNKSETLSVNSFVIDTQAPDLSAIVSPVGYIKSANANFTWKAVTDPSGPVKYQIRYSDQVETESGELVNPVTTALGTETTYDLPAGLVEGTTYWWQVRNQDSLGNSLGWSEPVRFVIDDSAPEVEDIDDVVTNKAVTKEVDAQDEVMGKDLGYSWTSESEEVVIADPTENETEISATKDGAYTITVAVEDAAGNKTTKTFKFTWDTTVSKVSGLYAVPGDGHIDLHWTNPTDTDFAKIELYRNIEGKEPELLQTLTKVTEDYTDWEVVNGIKYYYTVRTLDSIGNHADSNKLAVTSEAAVVANVNPVAPAAVVADAGTTTLAPRSVAGSQVQAPATTGEVKGGNTNENKDENKTGDDDNARTLSMFGVGLLVLLALVGLYLLYLQNPDWFAWLFFWKKKKDKKNLKK
jgi:hypothetical protein